MAGARAANMERKKTVTDVLRQRKTPMGRMGQFKAKLKDAGTDAASYVKRQRGVGSPAGDKRNERINARFMRNRAVGEKGRVGFKYPRWKSHSHYLKVPLSLTL